MNAPHQTSPLKDAYQTGMFPSWCPGCGDFAIWASLKQALSELGLAPHQVLAIFGIGCSGNMASFLHCYSIHSLHGRAIPTAVGAKLADHRMPVVVIAGDGDLLGEGLSHLVHAARGNHDIAVILHNNGVYGLTTGQASPTAATGFHAKAAPRGGVIDQPINPCGLVISHGAGYVARGFSGDLPQLTTLIKGAVSHRCFSFVEVLQPCTTFNHSETYQWYRDRIRRVDSPATTISDAVKLAEGGADVVYTGLLFQHHRPPFHQHLPQLSDGTLRERTGVKRNVSSLLQSFQ